MTTQILIAKAESVEQSFHDGETGEMTALTLDELALIGGGEAGINIV